MKLEFGICPQCKNDIPSERLSENVVVCPSCGYTDNKGDKKVESQLFKSFAKRGILMSLLMVGGFIQTVEYDEYAIEVIPLQIKSMTGMASEQDYSNLARICKDRKKWDCMQEALTQQHRKNPQNLEPLFLVGELQFKKGEFQKSIKTLGYYINQGGLNLMAAYYKAQSHGELGEIAEASQLFEQILSAKPVTHQITVAQKYVNLLLKHQMNSQAKRVIEEVRALGVNSSLFMEQEFKALAKK